MRNFFLFANETKNFNFFAASLVDIKIEFSEKFKDNRNDDSVRKTQAIEIETIPSTKLSEIYPCYRSIAVISCL